MQQCLRSMANRFYKKEDGIFDTETTMVTRQPAARSKLLMLFFILLLGSGLIFAGIRFLSLPKENKPTPVIPSPTAGLTPTETVTPTSSPSGSITPSPSVSPKNETLNLEILNGSGKPGAALTLAGPLRKLGYTVSKTGNADSFTYEQVTIKIKKSKSSALPALKKAVETVAPVGSTLTTLPESSSVDAEIIVGK